MFTNKRTHIYLMTTLNLQIKPQAEIKFPARSQYNL